MFIGYIMIKPILCLDFDGVCHSYSSGWKGLCDIPDPPVPGLFEFLERATEVFEIHIYSARSVRHDSRDAMKEWFINEWVEENGADPVPEYISRLVFPATKPPAFVSLDDRVLTFTGEWPDPSDLLAFKAWSEPGVTSANQSTVIWPMRWLRHRG